MPTMLIGSQAAKYHFPDFWREPNDVDLMCEVHPGNLPGVEFIECPVYFLKNAHHAIIPKDHLYTLKMSHIFWNHKWDKHFSDLLFMSSRCTLDWDLFFDLYHYWQLNKPSEPRSDLNKTAQEFFDNALTGGYNHDALHEKLHPEPAYKQILIGEVQTSDELFFKLPDSEKARVITEEVMVMAFERLNGRRWDVAYVWMLKKFIRQHSPIKQAIWAIENFDLVRRPSFNYVQKLSQ